MTSTTACSPAAAVAAAAQALGISPDADQLTIRRARRDGARRTHPDFHGGSDDQLRLVVAASDLLQARTAGTTLNPADCALVVDLLAAVGTQARTDPAPAGRCTPLPTLVTAAYTSLTNHTARFTAYA